MFLTVLLHSSVCHNLIPQCGHSLVMVMWYHVIHNRVALVWKDVVHNHKTPHAWKEYYYSTIESLLPYSERKFKMNFLSQHMY